MAIDDRKDSGARNSFAGKHCGVRRGDARCLFQLDDKQVSGAPDSHQPQGGRDMAVGDADDKPAW
ncbi:MAG: hypothetical protein J0I79_27460 [Mesorhizobium sp.]|uniref:hypothetical protein n=1 Tax=Mesorhizobium sp. TaxID=1871066 RepID=UPI001AD59CC6|nr:hypothetical protein [Mesorhizobium sp.]MBN9221699.1 hypothetical protein [Mesorhizobium sp.]